MIFNGRMLNGVAVPDIPMELPDGTRLEIHIVAPKSAFEQNKSIAQLCAEQAVSAVSAMEDLAGDWPDEDSVELLIAQIREMRR